MQTFADALEEFDTRSLPWGPPTGLATLDELTGGMVPGQVWVLIGAPGQGRTTLLLHLAARWASFTRARVFLDCPREPVPRLVARLLAPLAHDNHGCIWRGNSPQVSLARSSLSDSGLVVAGAGRKRFSADPLPWLDHDPAALLIDDVDQFRGVTPAEVREWTSARTFTCITLPRHLVVRADREDADLDPAWARLADVIVDVRTVGLGVAAGDRDGEAELRVLWNRWGPRTTATVSYRPYYSLFADVRT